MCRYRVARAFAIQTRPRPPLDDAPRPFLPPVHPPRHRAGPPPKQSLAPHGRALRVRAHDLTRRELHAVARSGVVREAHKEAVYLRGMRQDSLIGTLNVKTIHGRKASGNPQL